ncbi:MAG TPA: hypothetical protein VL360_08650 [Gammaproteobacteria bacterium]|nr:hypothetical protein [Gammaproteobacteria bacterium]
MNSQPLVPPFKSVAAALLFTALLGPVGLLYSSFWGGFLMIFISMVVVTSKLPIPIFLTWVFCNIWGVAATEAHNRRVLQNKV